MNARDHRQVTEADIQAYADGQITPGTELAEAVEARLGADPGARKRMQAYVRQNEAIREHYRDVLSEPLPEQLRPEVIRARSGMPAIRSAGSMPRLAAGVATVSFAVLLGWLIGQSASEPLERFAGRVSEHWADSDNLQPLSAESEALRSVEALGGAPDFSPEGLRLVGARQVEDNQMYEVQYRDVSGRELRLVMAPDPQRHDQLLSRTRDDGRQVVYWKQGPLMYALTGDFSERDLDGLAHFAIERFTDDRGGRGFARTGNEKLESPEDSEPMNDSKQVVVSSDEGSLHTSQSEVSAEASADTGELNAEPLILRESSVNH